jgi:putative transcriptional regulator
MGYTGCDWDPRKNLQNYRKHGIKFEDACGIFDDPNLTQETDDRDYGEDRWIAIGRMDLEILVVVYTERNGKERILSARKAKRREERSPMARSADQDEIEQAETLLRKVKTDWARLAAMTDKEAHQNALADPDNPPLTDEQLARMRRVPNPQVIRESLGLTQREFARKLEIALGTLRDWEQGARRPDSAAKAYLRVIQQNPDAVLDALDRSRPQAAERAKLAG